MYASFNTTYCEKFVKMSKIDQTLSRNDGILS
jgi:hypothetical protein